VSRTLLFDWEPLDTLDGMVSEESATLEVELNPDGGFYLYGLSIQHIGSISPLLDSLNGSISEDWVALSDPKVDDVPFGVDCCLQDHFAMDSSLLGFPGISGLDIVDFIFCSAPGRNPETYRPNVIGLRCSQNC